MPIVSVVIGEGGSGGALAIGVGDRLLMLQYSIYSVISPEGCAGILWRSADKKDLAAEAMGVSAERIAKLGVVDEVHQGAARRRASRSAGDGGHASRTRCCGTSASCKPLPLEQLMKTREQRLRGYGVYSDG